MQPLLNSLPLVKNSETSPSMSSGGTIAEVSLNIYIISSAFFDIFLTSFILFVRSSILNWVSFERDTFFRSEDFDIIEMSLTLRLKLL